jgi:hypothetical protein
MCEALCSAMGFDFVTPCRLDVELQQIKQFMTLADNKPLDN